MASRNGDQGMSDPFQIFSAILGPLFEGPKDNAERDGSGLARQAPSPGSVQGSSSGEPAPEPGSRNRLSFAGRGAPRKTGSKVVALREWISSRKSDNRDARIAPRRSQDAG